MLWESRAGRLHPRSIRARLPARDEPILHKGQSVRMEVYLSDHPPMRIDLGVVRWAADGEDGIEFIRMQEEDASPLRWHAGQFEKDGARSDVGGRRK